MTQTQSHCLWLDSLDDSGETTYVHANYVTQCWSCVGTYEVVWQVSKEAFQGGLFEARAAHQPGGDLQVQTLAINARPAHTILPPLLGQFASYSIAL